MIIDLLLKIMPPPDYRFRIGATPESDNFTRKQRDGGKFARIEKQNWSILIKHGRDNAEPTPCPPASDYRLWLASFHFCDRRRRDVGNYSKMIEDAAQMAGLTLDDSPNKSAIWIRFPYLAADAGEMSYTIIDVWEKETVINHFERMCSDD